MGQSSSVNEKTVMHKFDRYCKLVLRGEKLSDEKEMNQRKHKEISISYLTEKELSELSIIDIYKVESEIFHVLDYDIEVKDDLLGKALKFLPRKKRNIILLYFFMDMSDTEIALYMKLAGSTVNYHRVCSIRLLKEIIEEIINGKK